MLTKEQIEAIEVGGDDHEWEMSGDLSLEDAREFRRLALLGLERDDAREQIRKEFAEELIASLDHCFENGTAVKRLGIEAGDEYLVNEGRLRELAALFVREMVLACRFKDMIKEHQSDARAERIGRAVLLSFGYSPDLYRSHADVIGTDDCVSEAASRLLRAIADAMEEP